jgi:septation ring formation regulator EzrA
MSLLTPWRRRRIERATRYFHALLEADADGDLVLDADDWHGGLNALREDLEASAKSNAEAQKEALDTLKREIEEELSSFRDTTISLLQELSEDVRKIKDNQAKNLGNMTGKKVAGAVKAVKNIQRRGSEFWSAKGHDSTS